MGVPVPLRIDFNRTAGVYVRDERFSERPSLGIENQTFLEILEPVARVFEEGRLYSQRQRLGVPQMIEEMRCMCLEAHTTSTRGTFAREDRTNLLNTLQSIKEKAEEGVNAAGMRAADMDFFSLPDLTDVIREAAMIHDEYLHNDDISEALMDVADNITASNKRLWRPKLETARPRIEYLDLPEANNDESNPEDQAFVKAALAEALAATEKDADVTPEDQAFVKTVLAEALAATEEMPELKEVSALEIS